MLNISNSSAVQASVFDRMWAAAVSIQYTSSTRPRGNLHVRWLPYDGSNLLATGGKSLTLQLPSNDAGVTQILTILAEEAKRQASTQEAVAHISITAPDPKMPVNACVLFANRKTHRIADCFGLAARDAQFGQVFGQVLAGLAAASGLSVSE